MLNNKVLSAVFLAILLLPAAARAADKVYSPNIVKGELELEYSGSTTFDSSHEKNNLQEHELEAEYGLTDRIKLELSGVFEKDVDEGTDYAATGFGVRYQFFEPGEKWADAGLLVAYARAAHDEEPDAIEAKLLLEKQTGAFLHRANIGFEQEVGSHASGTIAPVFLWSSRYRYNRHAEPGFEIQSEFGKLNESHGFAEQEHYAGPALYGEIVNHVKYEAAYLFGMSDAAAKGAARALLEYELYF